MEGWIKLHRKLLENAILYKPNYFQVWIYILLKVNHEEKKIIWNNETRVIPRGCGIFSQSKMSKELAISIGTINNVLKFLKSENQIEIKSTNKFTEIQVLKWNEYQNIESKSESTVKASRKHGETNNNDNNENNEKKMIDLNISDCKLPEDNIEYKVILSSIRLHKGFLINVPDNKDLEDIKVKDWVPYVRELMVKKEYSLEQIRDIAEFAFEDNQFWSKVIIDMKTLSTNFEKIKNQFLKAA